MRTTAFLRRVMQLVFALCFTAAAIAQTYPSRPIKIVVPFPAGSQTDLVARTLSVALQEELHQPVLVENKAGAAGAIAAESVAKSAPDGYTLMLTTAAIQAANASLFKKLPYHPVRDFAPVARVATTSMMLMVRPDHPATTLDALIDHLRSRPGKVAAAYGSPGAQVALAMLESQAKVKVLAIPYKGIPQAMTDVLGGQVEFTFVDVGNAVAQAKSGKLRGLGVTAPDRAVLAPEVPALREKLPGLELVSWYGLVAPAGTPTEAVSRLARTLADILQRPETQDKLVAIGTSPAPMDSTQFRGYIQQEIDNWARLTRLADIKPE